MPYSFNPNTELEKRSSLARRYGHYDLALRLALCAEQTPCRSGACPRCTLTLRRALCDFAKAKRTDCSHAALSVVPSDRVAFGALTLSAGRKAQAKLLSAFRSSQIFDFLVGVDVALNSYPDNAKEPWWSIHFYGVAPYHFKSAEIFALRKTYEPADWVRRPCRIVEWDGNEAALRYALKATFNRRVLKTGSRFRSGQMRPCQVVSAQRLRSAEHAELLKFLDDLGLRSRVISGGSLRFDASRWEEAP